MELWRSTWRKFAALSSEQGLRALLEALETDSPRLLQGVTSSPPPMQSALDFEVQACCPIGTLVWADGLVTVGEIDEAFAAMCHAVDQAIGGPGECRWFLNWVDEMPREEMRQKLLEEVRFCLGNLADPAKQATA